jgi:hypothetical protein
MWELRDFKAVQTSNAGKLFWSVKSQYEYDCAEEQRRFLAFAYFSEPMGKGTVVHTDSDPDKWQPVYPGSVGQILWKRACGEE